jgi:serine/threonine protein kinase
MFMKGDIVGPYKILEQFGQGGMATVYKAYQANLDRYVAIKVLHPALKEAEGFLERFEREAMMVAKLEHPNIVPIYDYDQHLGNPYLVMRFIDGETLKSYLMKGPISMPRIVQIVTCVGSVLAYAHEQDILHRDIKPSNIMLTEDGKVFVTDFGLARMVQIGESTLSLDMMVGTPQYISPEQAKGEKLDAGTDIYSMGVVIYELMVGQVPFNADTPYAIVHDHIFTPLPRPREVNPHVPVSIERFLLKALSKVRSERYATVTEMVDAFLTAVDQSGVEPLRPIARRRISAPTPKPKRTTQVSPGVGPEVSPGSEETSTLLISPRPIPVLPTPPPAAAAAKPARRRKRRRRPGAWALVGLALLISLLIAGGMVFSQVFIEEFDTVYSEVEDTGSSLDRPYDIASGGITTPFW